MKKKKITFLRGAAKNIGYKIIQLSALLSTYIIICNNIINNKINKY